MGNFEVVSKLKNGPFNIMQTLVIGDTHGYSFELQVLLEKAGLDTSSPWDILLIVRRLPSLLLK